MRDWIVLALAGLIVAAVVGFFLAIPLALNWWSCSRKAEVMGMDYRFGLGYGCMVKTRAGQWVPLKAIREVAP
jgi:hypothetical protein